MVGENSRTDADHDFFVQFEKRFEQRFADMRTANEQRFGDLDKANVVALSGQKEALKTASDTTDKALLAASLTVEKALVIERKSTEDKFNTLNENVRRMDGIIATMIPRGEVAATIEAVSDRVKKVEDWTLDKGGSSKGAAQLWAIIGGAIIIIIGIAALVLRHN
jgi:hypothetical protein